MSFIREYFWLALFTVLYVGGFGAYYLSTGNYEFMWYIVVLVFFMVFIGGTLKVSRLPMYLLWLLSLWGLLHMAGGGIKINGDVLYAKVLIPFITLGELSILKYDQLVHAYGFGVAAIILYVLLSRSIKDALTPFWFGVVVVLGAMGLGVVNELVEFAAVLVVPNGVGGYFNTLLDLVFNTVGAVVAVFALHFLGKKTAS